MKTFLQVIILLTVFIISGTSQEVKEQDIVMQKAENAFQQGNTLRTKSPLEAKRSYEEAALYYNSLIEQGVKNGSVYYNTGNAYFRSGQIGNAILMYRRALLFSPADPQIKYNLIQARKLQKNQLSYNGGNELLQIFLFPHLNIPLLWKLWSFIIINIGFWLYLVFLRLKKGSYTPLFISGFFLIILAASLFFDFKEASFKHGVITAEATTGRMGDSKNFETSFDTPLYQGLEFKVKEERVGWILVELDNGDITWIEESDCKIIEDL